MKYFCLNSEQFNCTLNWKMLHGRALNSYNNLKWQYSYYCVFFGYISLELYLISWEEHVTHIRNINNSGFLLSTRNFSYLWWSGHPWGFLCYSGIDSEITVTIRRVLHSYIPIRHACLFHISFIPNTQLVRQLLNNPSTLRTLIHRVCITSVTDPVSLRIV